MTAGLRLCELQRARLLSAITDAACERGAGNVTASDVVAKAGVSRRTFYELFASSEECLLAAIDDAINRVAEHVRPAYEAAEGWQEKMRNGLTAMLAVFDAQPTLGRLLIVELLAAGPRAAARRSAVLGVLAGAVDEGRLAGTKGEGKGTGAGEGEASLPGLAAQAVVGGVLAIIYEQLAGADHRHLARLAPQLTGLVVLPYRGAAACKRQLERPPVKPGARPHSACGEHDAAHRVLKDAALRLTDRTVLMLAAVAEHPGSSNRMLAEHVRMRDQGQASKLLMRLQARGLVENTSSDLRRGAPNSWRLTVRGRQLQALVARQRAG